MFSIENKVIVVTGGSGNLGSNLVRYLADQGACVASIDLQHDDCWNGLIMQLNADVTDKTALTTAREKIEQKWGGIDGLVTCAAIDSPPDASSKDNGPFEDFSEETFDKVMNVNVKGVFLSCQVFGKAMEKRRAGSIVNIGSIYGVVSPDQKIYEYRRERGENFYKPVAYSASKSALYNLTRYLAEYWASKNIRTNIITLAGMFADQDNDFLSAYCARVPMGRMATPSDYIGAIHFLLSDSSKYMTGSELRIDGGWTIK
ncbi:SDR family oxidoreductase [Legionella pneumophila]|uniref:SDR family oxidoreductase n=1 Tax=Legionella pneumophila TaxID=446 RepID=UPI0005C43224|nr:SDR family oxidoreductase [Legionella pneumophila]GAN29272.1 2-(S)-hydroxypropyl-CoM dehydrogenase [Legionella pneumophila]